MSKNQPNRSPTLAINPCNQFLIHYLLKERQKEGNNRMRGKGRNDHQYHLYSRAVDSIKKYPLPIICSEQLALLAGLGDWLIGKLELVIKQHYRRFLKSGPTVTNNTEQEKKQGKQNNKILNWMSEGSSKRSQSEIEPDQDDYQSQKNDKIHPLSVGVGSDCDSRSVKSQLGKNSLKYKPRQGSTAANVLKAMKVLNAAVNSVTKKDIDKWLLQNNCDKIKQWKGCKDNLLKNGYIQLDQSVDYQAYFLADRGQKYANQNQSQENSNLTKKKMQSEVNSFKQKFSEKQKEREQAMISQAINNSDMSQSMSRTYKNDIAVYRKRLEKKAEQTLILIIDTREMKDQTQRSYFQQTLTEKYHIDVITQSLTIGDFAFCYDGEVLDYIFERKKADDLASSIIDGRYKEQKYRLKNCGASNIIYLYEGHPSETSALKEKQLHNALLKTRAADGFKVYKTARTTETVKLLSCLHNELQTRINRGDELTTIGTIQQFNYRNTKNRYLTVETVFGLGLKSFPNVGRQTVMNILRYFKSYYLLYQELQKYASNAERIEFLNGLLKGGRTQAGVIILIVELLFGSENKKEEVTCSQLQQAIGSSQVD